MRSVNKISPTNLDENQTTKQPPSFLISTRFLLTIVIFLGYLVNYLQRTNISIAIVCMVNSTALLELDGSNFSSSNDSVCPSQLSEKYFDGKFVWKKADQGLVLSAYFYGYLITQIPGGWLAMRYGAKWVIFVTVLIPSILTLITPVVANLDSPPALVALRFIIGLIHGAMFSAIACMFSNWSVPKEKSRMIGFSMTGTSLGSVLSSIVGGILCENGFYEGWGSIFIIFGAVGILWLPLFYFLTSDSPLNHRFISNTERDYIISNLPPSQRPNKTPWKEIFKSKACWAIFISNFFFNWGGYLFLTQTPTFLKEVLKFDIQANGIFSSLPFVSEAIFTFVSGFISDKLTTKSILSLKNCRKLFNSLGMLLPMVLIFILGFINCSQPYLGVAILTIGFGFSGFALGAGYPVNINDVGGQNYSGIIYGISNTFGSIPGVIAPYFVGLMTPNGTSNEWRIVFITTAVFFFIGALPFIFYAQDKPEKWAIQTKETSTMDSINDNTTKQRPVVVSCLQT